MKKRIYLIFAFIFSYCFLFAQTEDKAQLERERQEIQKEIKEIQGEYDKLKGKTKQIKFYLQFLFIIFGHRKRVT